MKKIAILLLFTAWSVAHASSEAQTALKKISLMNYVTEEESKYGHDYKLSRFNFSFIPEAYAYSEGSACLILGFKSTFKNGMCRLSKAEGAKELAGSCKSGQLPCNPVVFGSQGGKPFCVSNYGGAELSRFCSHESFKSLSKSSEFKNFSKDSQEKLKEIARTKPRDFSFSQVKDLASDEKFNAAFLGGFKGGVEESKKFTDELCQSISSAPKKNKAHELDIANCSAQLDVLKSAKVETPKAIEVKKEKTKARVAVESKKEEKEKILPPTKHSVVAEALNKLFNPSLNNEEQCVPPEAQVIDEKKIEPIQKVPEMLEVKQWNDCAKELYNHKDVMESSRGSYYHDIDGKKTFAKQCWNLDHYGEKEIIYTFLSDDGFKAVKFPVYEYSPKGNGEKATLPSNIFRFKVNGKNYLISTYSNYGEYFDSLPEEKLTEFMTEKDLLFYSSVANVKKRQIDAYESFLAKDGKKTRALVDPVEAGISMDDAKACIKTRLLDYVSFAWYNTKPNALPRANELNTDLARPDKNAPDLQEKYKKTVSDIKKEMRESFFPEDSSCKGLFKDEEMDAMFDKNYGERINNYEKVRKYFVP